MFEKILIANRGEIAVRIIRAAREMGCRTVAIHSTADADALHVRLANESVCVGPPPARDSYLNVPNIISAALVSGADAIHPGYGFLAENANFAEICEKCHIQFIGPPPRVIASMGDKAAARKMAEEAGVPIVPGTQEMGNGDGDRAALRAAADIGYPVIIKAVAGGGGRGMRVCQNESELQRSLPQAMAEAAAAFGNNRVYLEKFIAEPRHVEVQILADSHGQVVHLGERDCSVQTARHQKMLEESPCSAINSNTRNRLGEMAVKAARAAGYVNAGTVEFLYDSGGNFYFIEMNTRIQVEHPVTEMVTGIDLVKEQLRVAAGDKLGYRQRSIRFSGHAIECRLTAEDPSRRFAPSSGRITRWDPPGGLGVRVDTHLYTGYTVPPYYDSLLAKFITHGRDRNEAIRRMEGALEECVIEGVANTRGYHLQILANTFFRKGEVYTNFLKRRMEEP